MASPRSESVSNRAVEELRAGAQAAIENISATVAKNVRLFPGGITSIAVALEVRNLGSINVAVSGPDKASASNVAASSSLMSEKR
jgi:hypothetical protein